MQADYIVLGGGNAKLLNRLPPGARLETIQTHSRLDTAFGPSSTFCGID